MKHYDVQSIDLKVSATKAFEYIANPKNLPKWTNAFASADDTEALLRTPQGEVAISLKVASAKEAGSVDWFMGFPDSSQATAFSRLVPLSDNHCVYSFVLTPPPVPLEALEGALEVQSKILNQELKNLKAILEAHGE